MQSNGFDRKMISGDLKKKYFFKSKGGTLVFSKTKIGLGVFFFEKNPMTNKIKKFLYVLEHLIPDGRDEIPTFALYHPLLLKRKVLSGINFRHEIYCLASSPWHSGQSRSRRWGWKMSEIFKKKAKHKMSTRTKRWKPKLSEFLTICSSLPSSKYL